MSERKRLLARLVHDVGKYVARTAINLPAGDKAPPALVQMLATDLYALSGQRRASDVLDNLVATLPADVRADPRLAQAQVLLAEADGHEVALRAGDGQAVARCGAIALEVAALLRAMAHDPRYGVDP